MSKYRVTITVGCRFRKDKTPIDANQRRTMTRYAKQLLLSKCGGYTVTTNDGGWRNERGEDFEEPSLTFVIVMNPVVTEKFFERIAAEIRVMFEQECVLLVVEEVEARFI